MDRSRSEAAALLRKALRCRQTTLLNADNLRAPIDPANLPKLLFLTFAQAFWDLLERIHSTTLDEEMAVVYLLRLVQHKARDTGCYTPELASSCNIIQTFNPTFLGAWNDHAIRAVVQTLTLKDVGDDFSLWV